MPGQYKTALIHDIILDEGADLACITETWVGEESGVPLSQLCLPGYLVQHQCRSEGWGGGVAIVYRSYISLSRLLIPLRGGLEGLYCVLGLRNRLGILLMYCPLCCVPTISLPELTVRSLGPGVEDSQAVGAGGLHDWGSSGLHGCHDNHGAVTMCHQLDT